MKNYVNVTRYFDNDIKVNCFTKLSTIVNIIADEDYLLKTNLVLEDKIYKISNGQLVYRSATIY